MNAFPERPTSRPRFTMDPADLDIPPALAAAMADVSREHMLQHERAARSQALPLFAQGYRVTDLHIEYGQRWWTHGGINPGIVKLKHPVAPWRLWLRRQWRRVRPYRIPGVTDVHEG